MHGVVSLAGIPDLIEGLKFDMCDGAIVQLMGGLPEEFPERYMEGIIFVVWRTALVRSKVVFVQLYRNPLLDPMRYTGAQLQTC